MAFSNGAALVVGSKDTPRFGNDLPQYLARREMTYFSTVPTMLSTMTEEIPTLRQLVVSGEICPPDLSRGGARPGRLMLNVYGPTEATVNTTAKVCVTWGSRSPSATRCRDIRCSSRSVRCGRYRAGARANSIWRAQASARGYLKQTRIDVAALRVVLRGGAGSTEQAIWRRSMSAAKWNFSAASMIRSKFEDTGWNCRKSPRCCSSKRMSRPRPSKPRPGGVPALAAYVSLKIGEKRWIGRASQQTQGKTAGIHGPELSRRARRTADAEYRESRPQALAGADAAADRRSEGANPAGKCDGSQNRRHVGGDFNVKGVGVEQDFFLDLGGHSLFAAQMVARLRSPADLHISVRDVYAFPTVRKLAEHLRKDPRRRRRSVRPRAMRPASARRPAAGVAALQALLMASPGTRSRRRPSSCCRSPTIFCADASVLSRRSILTCIFYIRFAPLMLILGSAPNG